MQNARTKKTKWARRTVITAVLVGVVISFAMLSQKIVNDHTDNSSPKEYRARSQNNEVVSLTVAGVTLKTHVAHTPEQQRRGLCCRDSLPKDAAMLFVYETPGDYRFWMKDTRIPLDIYWLNSKKTIVHFEENVRPESYPKSFGSPEPAQYVLETNAGFANKHHVKIGDLVAF